MLCTRSDLPKVRKAWYVGASDINLVFYFRKPGQKMKKLILKGDFENSWIMEVYFLERFSLLAFRIFSIS